jgi:hypothetical protein
MNEGNGVEGAENPANRKALSNNPAVKKKGMKSPMPRPISFQTFLNV